ncbi:Hypothetical predicted protein [Paramuricea clavata]|uniref:Uncharacterized protein n=1 Tax=Paramuricea clavata TaxID=317549 RepID=A0A6S7HMW3_PARCT|nr:Hypothetical predicted protein [Paramuricea clavata]
MAAGGSINHPKSIREKSKRKVKKKVKKKRLNVDPLTTSHIIKKTRTNPNANITLSGKKRRLLLKQLKREEQDKKKMDDFCLKFFMQWKLLKNPNQKQQRRGRIRTQWRKWT